METSIFTKCFKNEKPILEQMKKLRHMLKTFCAKSLKKIRISKQGLENNNLKYDQLINKRNKKKLKYKKDTTEEGGIEYLEKNSCH